jgi:hypothetical protein
VTKAWLMGVQGRQLEASLLGEGSLRLLEGQGELTSELRARMNASNAYIASEPARGLEIAARGVELAERIGDADRGAALAGNEGICAVLLGRWEVPLQRVEELDRSHISGFGRLGLTGVVLIARAHLGLIEGRVEDELAAVDADDLEPAQRRSMLGAMGALAVYACGRLEDVEHAAEAAGEGTTNPMESALADCAVAHAHTWLGRPDRLAATIERLASETGLGQVISTSLLQARGALAAMEGRTSEAEEAYRAALKVWRRLDMQPDVATAEIEMLRLIGDALPDRDELREDARRITDELGSVTLLARLDEVALIEQQTEVVT